jgi:putative ABC transport system permease protein
MSTLLQDLKYGLRMLAKNPGFTAVAVLTLALGIGANTAIFTVDYATLLAPLPYPNAGKLVIVWSKVRGERSPVSAGDFLDWKRQNSSFQDLNALATRSFNIATREQPEYMQARAITPGLYQMLGSPPISLGRNFLPEESLPGKEHEVILTHRLWERLGGDAHILGTSMKINGEPYTVVGVLAPGLTDRGQGEFAVPLSFRPDQLNRDIHWLVVIGRLKPGVSIQQAQTEMDAVAARLAATYPGTNKGWSSSVEPLRNDFIPSERITMLWLLLGAVGFVLLIACANVANLMLAKGFSRQREMAIRGALGAQSTTVFRQLITESLLLAAAGGALGIVVGSAILRGLVSVMPPNTLPSEVNLSLNIPILLFTLAATTLAGVLFGCAPAWYASRVDPADALKEGGRSGMGSGRHRLRRGLVIAEFALTLTLLAGAGLAIHSFWNLSRIDTGIRADHALTFFLPVPNSRLNNPQQITDYYRRMLASVAAAPGVSHVSAETGTPLEGAGFNLAFSIAGQPAYSDPSQRPVADFQMVTPDYYRTFGIQLVQGRFFTDQDNASGTKVAIVNEDFVNHYLKGTNPLQQRVVMQQLTPGARGLGPAVEWRIVGVFHNVRSRGFREDNPEIDVPFWQSPWPSASIGIRTAEDPASVMRTVAAAVHDVDSQIALANPRTMEQVRDDVLASDRFTAILFCTFAAIALLLATLGIYGVMSFAVAQRSHEIGLRMALGARKVDVLTMVLGEGLGLALIGLAIGMAGALALTRFLASLLYGVTPTDPLTFIAVSLILIAVALLACYIPARRAAKVDPMVALRYE